MVTSEVSCILLFAISDDSGLRQVISLLCVLREPFEAWF